LLEVSQKKKVLIILRPLVLLLSKRLSDILNAFLNGVLVEEVYMQKPSGFIDSTLSSYICRLYKSLYGLK
jgi:hypothetical protein